MDDKNHCTEATPETITVPPPLRPDAEARVTSVSGPRRAYPGLRLKCSAGSQTRRYFCWAHIGASIRRAGPRRYLKQAVDFDPIFLFLAAIVGQRLMGFNRNKTLVCGACKHWL